VVHAARQLDVGLVVAEIETVTSAGDSSETLLSAPSATPGA
jgi:hypothetical protein